MKDLMTAAAGILERLGDTVPVSIALMPNTGLPVSVIATGDQCWHGDGDALIEATVAAFGIAPDNDTEMPIYTVHQDGVDATIMTAPTRQEEKERPPRMTSTSEHAAMLRQLIDWAGELPNAVKQMILVDSGTDLGVGINLTKQATDADWEALSILTVDIDDTDRRGGQGILPTGHSLTIAQTA